MDKKSIVYFGNTLYPDKDASAHRTIGNAKALRELGYNVILVGCRKGEACPLRETKVIFDGLCIYYYPEPNTLSQWIDYLFSFSPLKEILRAEEIYAVILYNHPAVSSERIKRYCHKRDIKVYADCTEWYDPKGFSIHSIIKKADTWYRMTHVNKNLDGIIAISSFLQDYYRKSECSTICVPPLVDLTSDKWQPRSNCERKEEITNLIYVGNPGAGAKDKLDIIIGALKSIREANTDLHFRLNVIGMSDKQFVDAFKMDISGCNFVSFLGRRPNAEALEMIKQSDFSIFLRDANLVCTAGFPTKFSESIACGTPVLTNITSDIGKYLIEGKNGFTIDTTSFKTICNTLSKALTTPSERISGMKEYCRQDRAFDYHSFINEFDKLF